MASSASDFCCAWTGPLTGRYCDAEMTPEHLQLYRGPQVGLAQKSGHLFCLDQPAAGPVAVIRARG
jgi:hypothetical protein